MGFEHIDNISEKPLQRTLNYLTEDQCKFMHFCRILQSERVCVCAVVGSTETFVIVT